MVYSIQDAPIYLKAPYCEKSEHRLDTHVAFYLFHLLARPNNRAQAIYFRSHTNCLYLIKVVLLFGCGGKKRRVSTALTVRLDDIVNYRPRYPYFSATVALLIILISSNNANSCSGLRFGLAPNFTPIFVRCSYSFSLPLQDMLTLKFGYTAHD